MTGLKHSRMIVGVMAAAAVVINAADIVAQHAEPDPMPEKAGSFQPVLYERERTIHLSGSPEEVFPLFEPDGFPKWNSSGTPPEKEVLFEGRGDTWTAYMSRVLSSHGDRWNIVAEHDRDAMLIRYVLLMPDVEFLVHEIQCLPNPRGSTIVLVSWQCAGLSEDGNKQISEFFDGGHFERQIDGWEKSVNEYLAAQSE